MACSTGLSVLSVQRVNLTKDAGWESIPHRSSRALVSLSFDTVVVGEADELEEDVGCSISCVEGVMDVEE